ncbi:MAG: VCBS repeat-containing protein [Planctomycetota bacterium]
MNTTPRPCCLSRSGRRGTLGLAVALSLGSLVTAQMRLDDLPRRHLPPSSDTTSAVLAVDVDGDGDQDVVVGTGGASGFSGPVRLLLNDGAGTLLDVTYSHMPAVTEATAGIAAGDVDRDGDTDVVVGNQGQDRLLLNDGSGRFTDVTAARFPAALDGTGGVALGDVDGDGDLDLVAALLGQNKLYLNDGTGTFGDATAVSLPVVDDHSRSLALADLDGDGDLDLVFGNGLATMAGLPNRLLLNTGAGTFVDAAAGRLPIEFEFTTAVAVGDLDQDGDPDLLLAQWGQSRLLLNDGTARFVDATAALPPAPDAANAAALVDVDADGDLDVVLGDVRGDQLLLNNGAGLFAAASTTHFPVGGPQTVAVTAADLDADGDVDLLFGDLVTPDRLYFNEGAGRFADATASRLSRRVDATSALAVGDVNGDGAIDLVEANQRGRNRLLTGRGDGRFDDATETRLPDDIDQTLSLALGDVDGDGDLDLITGNAGQNRLLVNDGSGRFVDRPASLPGAAATTAALALFDADADGDVDLLVGNLAQTNRLLLNDGFGTFRDGTASPLPSDGFYTNDLAVGDLNGDGAPDLVFGNGSPSRALQNALYLNDGAGGFVDVSASHLPADASLTSAVVLGDIDGDGDLDLVCANSSSPIVPTPRRNRLYVNDGAGVFAEVTAAQLPSDNDNSGAVALADFDLDGDPDLVFGGEGLAVIPGQGAPNQVYANDGTGRFTVATSALRPVPEQTFDLAIADVDQDGDLDLLAANAFAPTRLSLNRARQLHAPFLARLGQLYQLDAHAWRAAAGQATVAIPLLAPATARIPVAPFGVLGLAPELTLALPAVPVAPVSRTATVALRIPRVIALAGLALHAQAVVVSASGGAHLTNVTTDTVTR